MQIIHTISEIRQQVVTYRQKGKSIGFVPTMGNLHQGHLELVKMALSKTDIVICSIFVNPLQFSEGEDFEQYPRTLDRDTEKLKQTGCHIVFAPAVDEMYPQSTVDGRDQSQIIVPDISDIYEGASRPGHFTGVATIVAKLFNMVQPDTAVFGSKDYQQLQVIKRFVQDLCFPVEIISHPIVRETNGLAMSSRNSYLSSAQKQQAAAIYETLNNIEGQIHNGIKDYSALQRWAEEHLNHLGFRIDYVVICDADLNKPEMQSKQLVILAAAYLGNTRLIDNLQITI